MRLEQFFKLIDKWGGAHKPIHPLALRSKKNKYVGYFVLFLLFSFTFIGFGLSSLFDKSPGAADGALGLLLLGLSWALLAVLVLTFKWRQLERIPIDARAKAPDDFKTEVKKALTPDKGVLPGIVIMFVIFILAFVLAPPNPNESEKQQKQKKQDEATAYLEAYLQMALRPQHEMRLKPDGGDLRVYVAKSDSSLLPFPTARSL